MEPPQKNSPVERSIKATWTNQRDKRGPVDSPPTRPAAVPSSLSTCHGISPGIATSPPTMRLWGSGSSSLGTVVSLVVGRGNISPDSSSALSLASGKDAAVAPGAVGGHVEVLTLSGAVEFSRLEFCCLSRVLLKAEFTCTSAVLPQGNSASGVGDKRRNVSWSGPVATSQRGAHQRKDADTFWLTVKPIVRQSVSASAAAFGSKGSQRLAEVHTAAVVHVTPFSYNWREKRPHSFSPSVRPRSAAAANRGHPQLDELWCNPFTLEKDKEDSSQNGLELGIGT